MAQINFEGLRELQESANYLLDHCPNTRESLSQQGQEIWTEKVSETSLRMLDICNLSKDVMTLVKHTLQDLQLTLLRGNESSSSSSYNEKIAAYNRYKNKIKKETLRCLKNIKESNKGGGGGSEVVPIEHNLLFVSEVLKEVRGVIITMVESLFSLGCVPWLERSTITKGSLSNLFFSIRSSYCLDEVWDETAVHSAATRLEAAEIAVEELEIELESIFRRLIHTRVSLLNILTS
ncbi:unnamed protein product [Cochlearia groenlandica]